MKLNIDYLPDLETLKNYAISRKVNCVEKFTEIEKYFPRGSSKVNIMTVQKVEPLKFKTVVLGEEVHS